MIAKSKPLIDLKSAAIPLLPDRLCPLIEDVFSFSGLNGVYEEISQRMALAGCEKNFFETAMDVLGLSYEMEEGDLENIPANGPVIVVANHPFGGLDGVILGSVLTKARPDARLIANYLLDGIEELRPWTFRVDPFDRPESAIGSLAGMMQTMEWLKDGGLVGTFPAGMVSRASFRERTVTDRRWNPSMARLVRRTKATVVPVYFDGSNSLLFQTAGLVHPALRTVLLPRELVKRKDRNIRLKVGAPIPYRNLKNFDNDENMTAFLRLNVYLLKNKFSRRSKRFVGPLFQERGNNQRPVSIISPVPRNKVKNEMESLPDEQHLLTQRNFQVFHASSDQIPETLREIGRLREITFRQAKEGTGTACALEPCDSYYQHLFMWNSEKEEIVGGYRLGLADKIIPEYGIKGLYTSKLFAYKAEFFAKLNPAIELGRSFIRPEYQKKHTALALVWRGIGEYLAHNPRYTMLFGAVSTSQDYLVISKEIIMEFLRHNVFDASLAPFVKAKNPPPPAALPRSERDSIRKGLRRIDDVSSLISGLEKDGKGVPVLLRQYLKLNGAILSFNIDNEFCNVMDSLMVVDARRADRRIMKRFMGEEGAARYLAYHGLEE